MNLESQPKVLEMQSKNFKDNIMIEIGEKIVVALVIALSILFIGRMCFNHGVKFGRILEQQEQQEHAN